MSGGRARECGTCRSAPCVCKVDWDFAEGRPSPKAPDHKKAEAFARKLLGGPPAHRNLALAYLALAKRGER